MAAAYERLRILTRSILNGYSKVRRFEQTDDVLQNAAIRLCRALESVQPDSVRSFFGLAAMQIRRELIDLARHYYGPHGVGKKQAELRSPALIERDDEDLFNPADPTDGPQTLSEWTNLHHKIQNLPQREREVFDLLYYGGLSQKEAAKVLDVDERTIKRRWRSGRLALYQALHGNMPGR